MCETCIRTCVELVCEQVAVSDQICIIDIHIYVIQYYHVVIVNINVNLIVGLLDKSFVMPTYMYAHYGT